jgi:GNAT superfamily N-acetyltransferase
MLRTAFSLEGIDYVLPAGYTMRSATLDDVPAAVAVINAHTQKLIGADEITPQSLQVEWSAPQVTLTDDAKVILAPAGQLVACAGVWGLFEPYARINTWWRVHPDHQQRGLEAAVLDWAEEHVRQVAFAKAAVGTRICLTGYRPMQDALGIAAYEQAGFVTVRYMHRMRIDLDGVTPAPVWPEGITVRSFVPGQDEAAVIQAQQSIFLDHWGYVAPSVEEDLKMIFTVQ